MNLNRAELFIAAAGCGYTMLSVSGKTLLLVRTDAKSYLEYIFTFGSDIATYSKFPIVSDCAKLQWSVTTESGQEIHIATGDSDLSVHKITGVMEHAMLDRPYIYPLLSVYDCASTLWTAISV